MELCTLSCVDIATLLLLFAPPRLAGAKLNSNVKYKVRVREMGIFTQNYPLNLHFQSFIHFQSVHFLLIRFFALTLVTFTTFTFSSDSVTFYLI